MFVESEQERRQHWTPRSERPYRLIGTGGGDGPAEWEEASPGKEQPGQVCPLPGQQPCAVLVVTLLSLLKHL